MLIVVSAVLIRNNFLHKNIIIRVRKDSFSSFLSHSHPAPSDAKLTMMYYAEFWVAVPDESESGSHIGKMASNFPINTVDQAGTTKLIIYLLDVEMYLEIYLLDLQFGNIFTRFGKFAESSGNIN